METPPPQQPPISSARKRAPPCQKDAMVTFFLKRLLPRNLWSLLSETSRATNRQGTREAERGGERDGCVSCSGAEVSLCFRQWRTVWTHGAASPTASSSSMGVAPHVHDRPAVIYCQCCENCAKPKYWNQKLKKLETTKLGRKKKNYQIWLRGSTLLRGVFLFFF